MKSLKILYEELINEIGVLNVNDKYATFSDEDLEMIDGSHHIGGLSINNSPEKSFVDKMNQELIEAVRIDTDDTERERLYLKRLLLDYVHETESDAAQNILENFRAEIRNFWMVKPKNMTVLPLDPDKGD